MDKIDTAGALWSVMAIAGPIVLALLIAFALLRNRRTRAEKERTEESLRDQHNVARRKEGLPPKTGPVPPRSA